MSETEFIEGDDWSGVGSDLGETNFGGRDGDEGDEDEEEEEERGGRTGSH